SGSDDLYFGIPNTHHIKPMYPIRCTLRAIRDHRYDHEYLHPTLLYMLPQGAHLSFSTASTPYREGTVQHHQNCTIMISHGYPNKRYATVRASTGGRSQMNSPTFRADGDPTGPGYGPY